MRYLLNVVYLTLIVLGLPWFLYKAVTAKKYREGLLQKFFGLVPQRKGEQPCVWFHAVSVGEVRALRTVLEEIQHRRPDWQCAVSTTTRTGMQTARSLYPDLLLFYCPLDFTWATQRALRRIRPDLLALVELELWPNLVNQAQKCGVLVTLVNGRMSPRSYRGYRRIRFFVRRLLGKIDGFAVQNEAYAGRFRGLGADAARVVVTGSVKYDAIETDRSNPRTRHLAKLLGIGKDEIVFIAGSTLEPEEHVALDVYLRLKPCHPRLRLIVVPRHPERFDSVARLLAERSVSYLRRSLIETRATTEADETPVILLDTLGELSALWGLAHVAFVGGSLAPRGGQNMIEPAAFGAAVLFGPHTWNFQETVDSLLACGGARSIQEASGLESALEELLFDSDRALEMGSAARRYVVGQKGASAHTVSLLEKLMERKRRLWSSSQLAYNAHSEPELPAPHRPVGKKSKNALSDPSKQRRRD